jgi:thiamine-monophosphate kinase
MESRLIAWLRERLPRHSQLLLGPGDDAAVLRLAERSNCVVTTDMLMDGVDFLLESTDPRRIGHKALAVNLSDLAAMAARPLAAVVSVALPRSGGFELGRELVEGMLPLAERHHVAFAGGDTNSWDHPLVISVTAIGETTDRGPLLRSGARPGDRILVTGEFGASILGRHLDFEPRIRESLLLREKYDLHAGIDCSDGLSLDLSRVCQESACGAVIDLSSVPISAAADELSRQKHDGRTLLDHALCDGEDFELILSVAPDVADILVRDQPLGDVRLTDVGEFVAKCGLWSLDSNGQIIELRPRGYEHQFE